MLNPKIIRDDFPIFERKINTNPLVYLDNAATTQKPRVVIDGIRDFYMNHYANIHRGVHTLSYEATEKYEEAHKKIQRFISAKTWREIVFLRNATEAINLVAYSFVRKKLKEGDEILTTVMEHHSNFVPWLVVSKELGIELRIADITDDGKLDLTDFERKLSNRTKLVALTHVSNILGTVNPLRQIIHLSKEKGAKVLIDGAQGLPHLKVDVQDLDCDFYAGSGHKMLGPTGIGFLYAKRELLEEMEPFLTGGDMIENVTLTDVKWNELPWKFEAGTSNIAGGIGLGYAVDYLEKLGMKNITEYEEFLTHKTIEKLEEIEGLKIYGPKKDRLGVISFEIDGVHPHDIAYLLDREGIAIRSGHHCAQPLLMRLKTEGVARMSLYIYNTEEEIDKAVDVIKFIAEKFRATLKGK